MNVLVKFLALLLAASSLAQADTQATYYVDPVLGSDTNSGSLTSPFHTIVKARDTIQPLSDSMTGDLVVHLRGGIYPLTEPLNLNEQHSGKNGHRIIYRNHPDEEPIISGGQQIDGWTAGPNGIYSASANSLVFNQLSVNGRPAQRARYPEVGSPFQIIGNNDANQQIRINASEIENWSNLNRVQMVIASSFTSCRLRIESFVESGDEAIVTPMDPERAAYWGWLDGPLDGTPSYYFENHLDFLDTPGEWFLDLDTDTVYYLPLPDQDMATATVSVPQLERLLHVADAENITFFGITFENASWLAPMNQGMIQRQGSMQVLTSSNGSSTTQFNVVPVATYFKKISNVRIERCIFMKMGAAAMGFDTGTSNNTIVGNVFSEIAESAIIYDMDNFRFATGDDLSSQDTFDSNYFFRIGTRFFGGTGLFAFWPDRITITHNEFSQINGLGMNVGWGATYDTVATKEPVVTHNRMHDVALRARDSGAIHTKSDQSGALYSQNWIYNSTPRSWWDTGPVRFSHGIYLDDNSENTTLTSNVFMNIHDTDIKVKGLNHTITGNGTQNQSVKDESGIRSGYADIKNFWRGGAIGRNLEPGAPYLSPAPDLGSVIDDTFDSEPIGSQPAGYTYGLTGGTIGVVNVPANGNQSLRITDNDPSNSVGASLNKSIGEQSEIFSCTIRMKAGQINNSMFFKLLDSESKKACHVGFSGNGNLRYFYQSGSFTDITSYSIGTWYTFRIEMDVRKQTFNVWINDELALGESMFFQPTGNITTLELSNTFQTGFFDLDFLQVESELTPSTSRTTNGTPHSWIDQYFDTADWTSADYELKDTQDDDQDGATTSQEYLAGTNPDDQTSVLNTLLVSSTEDTFSLSWKSQRDRNYSIQTSSVLLPDHWTNVLNPEFTNIPGTGGIKTFSEEIDTSRKFFRVLVE